MGCCCPSYIAIPNYASGLLEAIIIGTLLSVVTRQRMGIQGGQPFDKDDVTFLTELIQAGPVTPVIDRRYPLSEVPAAPVSRLTATLWPSSSSPYDEASQWPQHMRRQSVSADREKAEHPYRNVGAAIAIGAGIGVALGVTQDNVALGIGVGVALAAAIGTTLRRRSKHADPD